MKTRKLGNSKLEVSALGFGAMGLSFPNAPSKEECVKPVSYTHLDVYKRQADNIGIKHTFSHNNSYFFFR